MKQRTFVAILTAVIVILCGLGVFVGVKVVGLIHERDSYKAMLDDKEKNTGDAQTTELNTKENDGLNKKDLVFVSTDEDGGETYRDSEYNEYVFNATGTLVKTFAKPGAWSEDAAMDADALLDVAHAYMVDTYGADFAPFAYTATHSNRTTDDHKSYIIEYRNVTEDQFYFICIWDNGVVLWSQFSDTADVQTAE